MKTHMKIHSEEEFVKYLKLQKQWGPQYKVFKIENIKKKS